MWKFTALYVLGTFGVIGLCMLKAMRDDQKRRRERLGGDLGIHLLSKSIIKGGKNGEPR